MYIGSECVEIWLGVRRALLGRLARFVPFPAPFACVFEPASCSAVTSVLPFETVPVVAPAACAAPLPQLRSEPRRKRRPLQATIVPATNSAAMTTSGICADARSIDREERWGAQRLSRPPRGGRRGREGEGGSAQKQGFVSCVVADVWVGWGTC